MSSLPPKQKERLTLKDLNKILRATLSAQAKWYCIGIMLGMEPAQLDTIKAEYASASDCYSAMLRGWLKKITPVPTYEELACVLRDKSVGFTNLAQSLEKLFSSSTYQIADQVTNSSMHQFRHLTLKTIYTELSIVKYKWHKIGIQLGIPLYMLEEFRKHDDPLSAAINYWLNGNVESVPLSWKSIISALNSSHVKELGLAKRINSNFLLDYQDDKNECTFNVHHSDNASAVISVVTSSDSNISSGLVPVALCSYFPFLPTSDRAEAKYNISKLDNETKRMKSKFASLVYDLQVKLESDQKLVNVINLLTYHDKSYECILSGCDTIAEVLSRLSRFTSFFDYEIIKLLIKKLGGDQLQEDLVMYKRAFQKYSKRRICECPSDTFGSAEQSEKLYVLKIERSITDLCLEEVDKLSFRMNRVLGTKILRLVSVSDGCVELAYRACLEDIKLGEDSFSALNDIGGVISLSFGDYKYVETLTQKGKDLTIEDDDSGYDTKNSVSHSAYDVRNSVSHSVDGNSEVIEETRTQTSDDFKDYVERDLKDLRLEMIASADTATEYSFDLQRAAEEGNLEKVKYLVTNGNNPMIKNDDDDTALHAAADYGQLEVLKYLIEDEGCNPASLGWHGSTPLHCAAEAKHLSVVKYLVNKHQVDSLFQDEYGYSSLHRACSGGDLAIVQFLMENILTYMKMEDIFRDFTKHDTSPIHLAAIKGHINIIKYFIITLQCDPNLADNVYCRGPIFDAAQEGHLPIVKFLIECGCDPACTDHEMTTLLHIAAAYGQMPVVDFLTREMKCDPCCRNNKNNTPIHNAALSGHIDVVEFLISDLQCSPNIPGQFGRTPFHSASQSGNLNLVNCLIEKYGCDPFSLDDNSASALHIAAMYGHLSVLQYLIEDKKCDPMCQDSYNNTPLHYAARDGQIEIVIFLVESLHCPFIMRGLHGMTPLEWAIEYEQSEVVEYFQTYIEFTSMPN